MEVKLLLAVTGAFAIGYALGGYVEVVKMIAFIHALEASDIPVESRGDLEAILTADEE